MSEDSDESDDGILRLTGKEAADRIEAIVSGFVPAPGDADGTGIVTFRWWKRVDDLIVAHLKDGLTRPIYWIQGGPRTGKSTWVAHHQQQNAAVKLDGERAIDDKVQLHACFDCLHLFGV